mmetsp:Transcript_16364/g.41836  ORF Transcript_16364/g.41836 Transcript_16364/m.41836 type:complete len:123 (-) Transcript_16364:142-510(-)
MGCFESRCKVEPITDAKQYEELVKNQACVIAIFHSRTDEKCQGFMPKFQDAASSIPGGMTFLSVEVSDAPEIAASQKAGTDLPKFIMTVKGSEVASFSTADEEKFKEEFGKIKEKALSLVGK